jgi:hypothetical protein
MHGLNSITMELSETTIVVVQPGKEVVNYVRMIGG